MEIWAVGHKPGDLHGADMSLPNPVPNNSWIAAFLNRILAAVKSYRIVEGPGYRVKQSTTGTVLDILDQKGGTPGVGLYLLKSHEKDYLICNSWNGTTKGTDDVYIAKPQELRSTFVAATVDGTPVSYTSYNATTQTRIATGGGKTENQVIVPRYLVDANDTSKTSVIYAMSATTLATYGSNPATPISLIDLNIAGRAFSQQ